MNKEQIDELYHLLRVVSNIVEAGAPMRIGGKTVDLETGLTPHEEVGVLLGLCRHLLAGGDYAALLQFSQYYGERFLLDRTYEAIAWRGWKPTRIVEFGAGLGWLGRGLAVKLGLLPALFIDKRPWTLIDLVADLETKSGMSTVLASLKENDLIVASDLLHCLDVPREVMEVFARWPMAILEYAPVHQDYKESYSVQISRYGAKPLGPEVFQDIFPNRHVEVENLEPYALLLLD